MGRKKILIIGLDGTKGSVFDPMSANQTACPNFYSIRTSGKATYCDAVGSTACAHAHSGNRFGSQYPSMNSTWEWVTSPGWATVVTGVDNFHHSVQNNDYTGQRPFFNTTKHFPTFFSQARAMGLQTAASGAPAFLSAQESMPFVTSNGIVDYECGVNDVERRPSVHATATSSCNLNYRAGQSPDDLSRDNKTTAFGVTHILDGCADIVMTHFDLIDEAGHECGFTANPCYEGQMMVVDGQVGQLLSAVQKAVSERHESWLVMVTSDHGGHQSGHGDQWLDDEVIPFMMTIYSAQNYTLKNLVYPVTQMDVKPTVMTWLGAAVGFTDGRVQGLE
jgi:predicted AlkP superfamily pyrophosphatase or phosphodiesterase